MRFSRQGRMEFGIMEADSVRACRGDMFSTWEKTGELIALNEIRWKTPCTPTKMLALRNNFQEITAKSSLGIPSEPLFFLKSTSSFCPHHAAIPAPKSYSGKVLYEGELG